MGSFASFAERGRFEACRANCQNDSQIEQFCCVHCAMLRYEKVKDDVSQIICRDFCWIRRSAPKLPSFAGYRSSFELLRAACAPFRF
ncbi:hypothetical protein PO124_30165 [Bacillus licheniformis]|nr:hypothetical protein [Bacillus licheniformis]